MNTQFLPNYDIITSPEEYIELSYESLKNKAVLLGEANPSAWASSNLYGTAEGINNAYNIWNVAGINLSINQLVDSTGIERRYQPTRWSDVHLVLDTDKKLTYNLVVVTIKHNMHHHLDI